MKRFLFFIFLIFITITPIHAAYSDTTIENMDYNITVKENHEYLISVNENVYFSSPHHGIYRAFAQSGTVYRNENNQNLTDSYYANISNVKVESGQSYNIEEQGDAFILRIGSANQYVNGTVNYKYSFIYDPGDDGYDFFDDVYFNLISKYMEDPIEHLNVRIEMPKPFDSNKITFFSGDYGTTINNYMNVNVNGNIITASSNRPIQPGEILSFRITLPEGYFIGATTGKEQLPFYYGLATILVILSLIVYYFNGRNKKPLEPVTFYPPNDYDPVQVAYILNNDVSTESLVSLLIYFASKGWLTIENISENEKNPYYVIHKQTDIPITQPIYERTIFNALFRKTENPTLNELTNNRSIGQAFLLAKQQVSDWFKGPNQIIAIRTYIAKGILIIGLIILNIFTYINLSLITMHIIKIEFVYLYIILFLGFLVPFACILSNKKKAMILGTIMLGVLGVFLYFMTHQLVFTIIYLVSSLIITYLGTISNKRTPEGNKLYGECLAFKHFIKTAELDRIKLLVEENPEYYYDILPYAYSMGLTDKWIKNFESLALNPPDWYIDPYMSLNTSYFLRNMLFMQMFNNGINRSITSASRNLSRMGTGGFGGGFSGGGFGGGGFGGMGGGSW